MSRGRSVSSSSYSSRLSSCNAFLILLSVAFHGFDDYASDDKDDCYDDADAGANLGLRAGGAANEQEEENYHSDNSLLALFILPNSLTTMVIMVVVWRMIYHHLMYHISYDIMMYFSITCKVALLISEIPGCR